MHKINIFFSFILLLAINFSAQAQKPKQKINEFTGELEKGKIYSAEIEFDEGFREWQTVKPLKLHFHHAGRIEFMNIKNFNLSQNSKQKIVFKVISKKIYQAGRNRWNTIYQTKIIYLISEK